MILTKLVVVNFTQRWQTKYTKMPLTHAFNLTLQLLCRKIKILVSIMLDIVFMYNKVMSNRILCTQPKTIQVTMMITRVTMATVTNTSTTVTSMDTNTDISMVKPFSNIFTRYTNRKHYCMVYLHLFHTVLFQSSK